jgi:hypothetical protein
MYKIVQGLVPVSCSNLLRIKISKYTWTLIPTYSLQRPPTTYPFPQEQLTSETVFLQTFLQIATHLTLVSVFHHCLILVMFSVLLRPSAEPGDRGLCLGVWSSITHMLAEKFQFPLETVPTWRSGILAELPISARDRSRFFYSFSII